MAAPRCRVSLMDAPIVSVVVSAHNKQAYVGEAVRSALVQSLRAIEVVVVDDASTDATREVVQALASEDPRVRLVALSDNVGQPAALNIGLREARGEWVAILDGDDWVAPTLYAELIALAEAHGANVVAGNMQWVFGSEAPPWHTLLPAGDAPLLLSAVEFIRRSMTDDMMPLSFLQPLVRRRLVVDHAIRYDESDRFDLDFGILVRAILAGGRLVVTPKVGYYYRQVPGSMMSTRGPEVLRRMKGANDALLGLCRHYGDRAAEAAIARRSRSVQHEIERAELARALRRGEWGTALPQALRRPGHVAALAWRRLRGRLYWARRRRAFAQMGDPG
ncbi:MAG: glycosyltransferase family 2 protein [Alphaproteobacteria bacterium]